MLLEIRLLALFAHAPTASAFLADEAAVGDFAGRVLSCIAMLLSHPHNAPARYQMHLVLMTWVLGWCYFCACA